MNLDVCVQLAGAGVGAVGGALLGRSGNNQGAQNRGVQDLGGQGQGADPGQLGQQVGQGAGGNANPGARGGQAQQDPAAQISNVLNGGAGNNRGNLGNAGNGGGANRGDTRGNTGDQRGRSAADIAATSPQSNVFRSDARTAATDPRETLPSLSRCLHITTTTIIITLASHKLGAPLLLNVAPS